MSSHLLNCFKSLSFTSFYFIGSCSYPSAPYIKLLFSCLIAVLYLLFSDFLSVSFFPSTSMWLTGGSTWVCRPNEGPSHHDSRPSIRSSRIYECSPCNISCWIRSLVWRRNRCHETIWRHGELETVTLFYFRWAILFIITELYCLRNYVFHRPMLTEV